ncbi:MAG: hypothetical protein AB7I33_11045 [Gemmatimonadales bacterium]
MAEIKEKDAMICRACGREERASEGYPCQSCGTFICIICTFKGVTLCKKCWEEKRARRSSGEMKPPE